jgi:hypothetical protein
MRYIKYIFILIVVIIAGTHVPYKYNNQKAVEHAVHNVRSKSHSMCAWYVMRSLQVGGCPNGIYPAYAYHETLPKLGFTEIDGKTLQKGDICVLSQNSKSNFGHIAIYDGKTWYSDYKQSDVYPSKVYRKESTCHYYRLDDGWHTANIWCSPVKLYEYIEVFFNNKSRIKF